MCSITIDQINQIEISQKTVLAMVNGKDLNLIKEINVINVIKEIKESE